MNNEIVLKQMLIKIDKKTSIKKRLIEEQRLVMSEGSRLVTEFKIITNNIEKNECELEMLVGIYCN
jgi:hypothetical protein